MMSIDFLPAIKEMQDKGWLDHFPNDHIIKMMLSDQDISHTIPKEFVSTMYHDCDLNATMLKNYNTLFQCMLNAYPEASAKKFVVSQLSGVERGNVYNNNKFFQALSELLLLRHLCMCGNPQVEYEPEMGGESGKKNPEYRIYNHFPNVEGNYVFDVEVKTVEGNLDKNINPNGLVAIPLKAINIKRKSELEEECNENGFQLELPDVIQIKDFINLATDKFVDINTHNHFNILCLNWTFRKIPRLSYLEPAMILTNRQNGLWVHKDKGMKLGISSKAYERISAIYIFNLPYEGFIFNDTRWAQINNSILILNDNLLDNEKEFLKKMFGNPATELQDISFLTNTEDSILRSYLSDAVDLLNEIAL